MGLVDMSETLAFRVARQHVRTFGDEVQRRHAEALECRDCEDYLKLGIDAFDWLIRADIAIREAVCKKEAEFEPEVDDALEAMMRNWLMTSEIASKWIELQLKRGYRVEGLERFRVCEKEVRAIVRFFDEGEELPSRMADLCSRAIEEHENGETAEFV